MTENTNIEVKSFSVIVKTNEIKFKDVSTGISISDLREMVAKEIYEPARSIKLLYKDRILQLNHAISNYQIEDNAKIMALPCYTMKHGLWNFIDDYNHERNEMQNIKLVFFLNDKPIEKAQIDGNIEYYQPIGIYWQSRNINPMPYLENDFARIEKRVGRVTPIFEFKNNVAATQINIIFRECESNFESLLNQYQDRIRSKFAKKQNDIELNIIYSTVLDQHNYWFKQGNFRSTIKFLSTLEIRLTSISLQMQKLNIDGFHLLCLGKFIGERGAHLKSLNLNFRDNSFEGQLIVDLGEAISKLTCLESLELDFQNIIIYNQNQVVQLLEYIAASKNTLRSLVLYLPKDLNITYYESKTISHIFQNILSTFVNLDLLSFISDSRFQLSTDFYPALKTFIKSTINLIHFDFIFYCDYLQESRFFRQIDSILNTSENLTMLKFASFADDIAIESIRYRYIHLLQVQAYYKSISQHMMFKQGEILFDLFDI